MGENGPEIVTPGRSGYVHPASVTRRMMSGGGGFTLNGDLIVQAANDPHATAIAVRRELQKLANGQSANLSD